MDNSSKAPGAVRPVFAADTGMYGPHRRQAAAVDGPRGSAHTPRQVDGNDREADQDGEAQQIGDDERYDTLEDRCEAHILHDALDHEYVHADRRVDQPQLDGHDDDHAEPDRIEAERRDHREDDRHGQDDHGHGVHETSERDVHQHDQG